MGDVSPTTDSPSQTPSVFFDDYDYYYDDDVPQTTDSPSQTPSVFFDDYDYYYDDDALPTTSPSSDQSCTDSPLNFAFGNGDVGCSFFVSNPEDCSLNNAGTHCPDTCGQCDQYACSDSVPF